MLTFSRKVTVSKRKLSHAYAITREWEKNETVNNAMSFCSYNSIRQKNLYLLVTTGTSCFFDILNSR